MQEMTIRADEVRRGDRIFNRQAKHQAFRWSLVSSVGPTTTTVRTDLGQELRVKAIQIDTHGWYTVLLPGEGIRVQRFTS